MSGSDSDDAELQPVFEESHDPDCNVLEQLSSNDDDADVPQDTSNNTATHANCQDLLVAWSSGDERQTNSQTDIVSLHAKPQAKIQAKSKSKFGRGRRGDPAERALLAMHMRHSKERKRTQRINQESVTQLNKFIHNLRHRHQSISLQVVNKHGLLGLRAVHREEGDTKGQGKHRFIGMQEIANISFHSEWRPIILSKVFSLSKAWVSSLQRLGVDALLSAQIDMLAELIRLCSKHRPLITASRYAWDETTEKVSLEIRNAGTSEQQRSSHHVGVSRLTLYIYWLEIQTPIQFDIIVPPVTLMSTTAQGIWSAFRHHPMHSPIFKARDALFKLSKHEGDIEEGDNDYAQYMESLT